MRSGSKETELRPTAAIIPPPTDRLQRKQSYKAATGQSVRGDRLRIALCRRTTNVQLHYTPRTFSIFDELNSGLLAGFKQGGFKGMKLVALKGLTLSRLRR